MRFGRFELRFFHRTEIFGFTKFGTDTELTGFQSVWFGRLLVASNFLETKQIKEKEKANFPLVSHIFSSSKHQAPSKKKKKLKIMYIFRDHTKITKYIFPSAFPCFLTTQSPSTKQSSKKKKKKRQRSVPAKQCTETA